MFRILSAIATSVAIVTFAVEIVYGQWPQFGGPNRDFTSSDTGLLDQWPDAGPERLWVVERPGNYAGMAIDNGQLITMFTDADRQESVVCLDAQDGSIVWEYQYEVEAPPEKVMDNFGFGPNVTPLIHGNQVVTVGFMGEVHCLNRTDGKLIWHRNTRHKDNGKIHTFGYSISPMIYDDKVLIATGGPHGMIALDWKTGELVWRSDPIDISYASPFLIQVDGQDQVILMGSTEVVAIEPKTGEILWRFPHVNLNRNNCAQPLWGPDQRMFFSSHSNGGARVVELRQEDGITYANQLWYEPKIIFFHSASQRIGDYVYGASGHTRVNLLVAVHLKTGEVLWRKRGFNKANILLADEKAILLDEEGQLTLARLSPEDLTVISQCKPLEARAWAPPSLANGVLYLRDQKKVVALRLKASANSASAKAK